MLLERARPLVLILTDKTTDSGEPAVPRTVDY